MLVRYVNGIDNNRNVKEVQKPSIQWRSVFGFRSTQYPGWASVSVSSTMATTVDGSASANPPPPPHTHTHGLGVWWFVDAG